MTGNVLPGTVTIFRSGKYDEKVVVSTVADIKTILGGFAIFFRNRRRRSKSEDLSCTSSKTRWVHGGEDNEENMRVRTPYVTNVHLVDEDVFESPLMT